MERTYALESGESWLSRSNCVTWCNVLIFLSLKNEVTPHIFWGCCEDCRKTNVRSILLTSL